MVRFGIIGCGVIGLSTATALQSEYRDSEILLAGAEQGSALISHGAAGVFRPEPSLMPGLTCCNSEAACTECPFNRWCKRGQTYYWDLARGQDAAFAGAFFLPLYNVYEHLPHRSPFITKLCCGSKVVDKDELSSIGFNEGLNGGYSYVTCAVEGRYFLPYLLGNIQRNARFPVSLSVGQSVLFESMHDVYSWATSNKIDVVMNCSGLGASKLCRDRYLTPLRGRLVRVSAPWMKFGFYGPHDTYAYPGRDSVILGGFREPLPCTIDAPLRPEDTAASGEATKNILHRIKDTWCGPLSQGTITEEWTGLRPQRPIVRLELTWLNADGSEGPSSSDCLPVVHNYGHGSMGIALGRGTALDVVGLVDQALRRGASVNALPILAPGLEKLTLH
ncbi:D-aspartate oxidase [Fasciolopsis buskii]|uniref:D-aspartate oxidase n=1 Tax=Fasciolopsis buskii TaxID=27845 RepID=A0A8E0RL35_9TREM|nr:D-aspartate oxidase [Fasciolopsis buski]